MSILYHCICLIFSLISVFAQNSAESCQNSRDDASFLVFLLSMFGQTSLVRYGAARGLFDRHVSFSLCVMWQSYVAFSIGLTLIELIMIYLFDDFERSETLSSIRRVFF